MKLLVCAAEYPPLYSAGIGNVVYNVVSGLQESGVECTICSPTGPDIKLGSYSMIQRYGILGLLYYWREVAKHFRKRADNYDVAWLHNPLLITSSPFEKGLVTIHTTAHGESARRIFPWYLHLYYKISSKIEKYSLSKVNLESAKFTVVSPLILTELKEIGIERNKIIYIPNGVDIELFKPANDKKQLRKKFDLPSDNIILLSLGVLAERKHPHKLIEVFSLIEKKLKVVTLVVAGGGKLLPVIKRLAQRRELIKARFLGHVDHKTEAPELYACADYYIMTSRYEGQPLTLLEAMACGLPCIVSNIPNLSSIVQDANCGIVVDFSDEERAAEEIISYLKEGHPEHSRNAREYVANNLDWQIVVNRYLEEIKRLTHR